MKKRNLLYSLMVLFLFSSCEQEVDLNLFVEKPIIYANFNPDSLFTVWVSKTTPPESPFQRNPKVDNATIKVYENEKLIHILPLKRNAQTGPIGGSIYSLDRFYPQINAVYELEIEIPGLLPVYTRGEVPAAPQAPIVRILNTKKLPPEATPPGQEIYQVELDVEIFHESGQQEYFELSAYSPVVTFDVMNDDTVKIINGVHRDINLSKIDPAHTQVDGLISNLENQGIFFTDANRGEGSIKLRLFIEYDIYTESEIKAPIYFSLKKHQEAAYLFRKSVQSLEISPNTTFQYFIEPDMIYSNVGNGVGLFSGHNQRRFTIFF